VGTGKRSRRGSTSIAWRAAAGSATSASRSPCPTRKSGAKANNLGNIINLPPFEIKRRDRRRFECKFTEIIAMANVAVSSAVVAETEAVLP
jgi:hypothetical protein